MDELVTPAESMREAFEAGVPVLMLPPDWPEDATESEQKLMTLFMDVVFRGSEGRVRIHRTVSVAGLLFKKEAK